MQDIVGMKFHEHVKFLTLDGHAYMGALWWYSEPRWNELSDAHRRIVYDGFEHLKTVTRALPMRRQIEAYEAFRQAGGEVYSPTAEEKRAFEEAVGGMRGWFEERYGDEWLTRLDTAVAACEARIEDDFSIGDRRAN